jgi:hypothetical protein
MTALGVLALLAVLVVTIGPSVVIARTNTRLAQFIDGLTRRKDDQ